jgi:hypothetical protein
VFRVNKKDAIGGDGMTQFGRALHALNIDIICANSSQAKGRVERANGTLQDRLVKEMRLSGVDTIEAGNAFLPSFMEKYNARFSPKLPLTIVTSTVLWLLATTISTRRLPGRKSARSR